MTTRPPIDLTRLLTPQSIAIIGASSNNTSISGQPLRLMIEAGYAGKIYPVNPKRDEVQGVTRRKSRKRCAIAAKRVFHSNRSGPARRCDDNDHRSSNCEGGSQ